MQEEEEEEEKTRRCDGPGRCQNRIIEGMGCFVCRCREYCSEGCRDADLPNHSRWCDPLFSRRLQKILIFLPFGRNISFSTYYGEWRNGQCTIYQVNPFSERSYSGNCLVCNSSLENGCGRRYRLWNRSQWQHYVKCCQCKEIGSLLCKKTMVDRVYCFYTRVGHTLQMWQLMTRLDAIPRECIITIMFYYYRINWCKCTPGL